MKNSLLIATLEKKYGIDKLICTTNRPTSFISNHCTWAPNYKDFTGSNHAVLQANMARYHKTVNGWSEIGQHFTIFPDGKVLAGRNIDKVPAVIAGHNTGSIGIELLGNFDKGGDNMTTDQLFGMLLLNRRLCLENSIAPENLVYHSWYTDLKTCPGTNFLGAGNTKAAFKETLLPMMQSILKL